MEGLVGEMRAFAGTYAPVNWLICNGSMLPISETDFQQLYSLIGTAYGGDGRTNFRLPDLRGRMALGKGQGKGLSFYRLGDTGGVLDECLTEETMPEHNHIVRISSASSENVEHPSSSTLPGIIEPPEGSTDAFGYLKETASGITKKELNEETILNTGNDWPHNNVMPCMAITYIICYKGIYPQRK